MNHSDTQHLLPKNYSSLILCFSSDTPSHSCVNNVKLMKLPKSQKCRKWAKTVDMSSEGGAFNPLLSPPMFTCMFLSMIQFISKSSSSSPNGLISCSATWGMTMTLIRSLSTVVNVYPQSMWDGYRHHKWTRIT